MKKLFATACFMLAMFCADAQFLVFLDKGDQFISPEVDMVVMDKYSFAKLHYTADQYDTLKSQLTRYDSLLSAKESTEDELRADYERIILDKDEQLRDVSAAYEGMKSNLQQSIDQQNKLQIDYLKLQQRHKRAKRWRNIFMGTTALFGGIIVMAITH